MSNRDPDTIRPLSSPLQVKARVTFWRPVRLSGPLAMRSKDGDRVELRGDAECFEAVFTWPLYEDVWKGLVDDEARQQLQLRFRQDFDPTSPPERRSMAEFERFVRDVGAAAVSGASEWSSAEADGGELETEDPLLNGLLAFHGQLRWLCDIFRDVPGASVSVR